MDKVCRLGEVSGMECHDVKCVRAETSVAPVRVARWGWTLVIPLFGSFVSCDRLKQTGEQVKQTGEQVSDRVKQAGEEVKQAGERLLAVDGQEARKVEEARSKAEAVRKHPALGVLDSPFNKIFRERVGVLKRTQPSFFERSDWPERLAEEVALTGGRGGDGAGLGEPTDDSVLSVDEIRLHVERHMGKRRTVKGVIQKIHEVESSVEWVRFRLDGNLEVQMSRHEFLALRGLNAEFLRWRLRVEGGHLFVKGQEGFTKGNAVYFPRDVILLSEGAPVRVSGTVAVKGNRVWVEKAQMRSVIGGI